MQNVTIVRFDDKTRKISVEKTIQAFKEKELAEGLTAKLKLSPNSNFQLMIDEAFDSFAQSVATRNYGFDDSQDTYHAYYFVDGKKIPCFYEKNCGGFFCGRDVLVQLPYIGLKDSEHEGKLILLDSCV